MTLPCFLLDENLPHRAIRNLLLRREPAMHIWVIGQRDAPALSALDPELLTRIEERVWGASLPGEYQDQIMYLPLAY